MAYLNLLTTLVALLVGNSFAKTLRENTDIVAASGVRLAIIPWIKERLTESSNLGSQYKILEDQVLMAGSQHFELLDERTLKKHRSDPTYYILGKRSFTRGNYYDAIKYLERVSRSSALYAHSQYILGVVGVVQRNFDRAKTNFQECLSKSEQWQSSFDGADYVKKEFKMIAEMCLVAEARRRYSSGSISISDDKFMELDKRSRIWPAILMDQGWIHFNLSNYNRTLGKLVTYNAPQLKYASEPEVYPLVAYSYLKMCLYDDVVAVSEKYSSELQGDWRDLNALLLHPLRYDTPVAENLGKNPSVYFYRESQKWAEVENKMITANTKLPYRNLQRDNLLDFVDFQNKIIARQVHKLAEKRIFDTRQSLEYLSYLKLEVLGRKKESLYSGKSLSGVRGDVKFLKRGNKQYFWNFKGEFWADELGDYVFALASECKEGAL